MGFQQGLSGLNASSKALDTIGNNIANSGTIGFKTGSTQFADVFAASLNGAGAAPVGLGSKVSAIVQQFTQGNISVTNNPLDTAINGGGFFQVDDGWAARCTAATASSSSTRTVSSSMPRVCSSRASWLSMA
jgi:flagellar hook protein FlgE